MRFSPVILLMSIVSIAYPALAQSPAETTLPRTVEESRRFVAENDPTSHPFSYEAEYTYTWHAKEVLVAPKDPPAQGQRFSGEIRIEPLNPPVISAGTIRVKESGDNLTIHIAPRQTAEQHMHLHQLRQPITIWRNAEEIAELRHFEETAIIEVQPTVRRPWPDQIIVPHVIFTAYLAPDWNRKFPRMFLDYEKLGEEFPLKTDVKPDGDAILVSESYEKPGVLTRYGPYIRERLTRYSPVGNKLLPTEISSLHGGVKEAAARIEWAVDGEGNPAKPLIPAVVHFGGFPPIPNRDSPLVLGTTQTFRINRQTVRFEPNDAGHVEIPEGFSVLKRYPVGDPRGEEEFVAGSARAATASPAQSGWLLASGTALVIIMIIGVFTAALRKASGNK